MTKNPTTEKSAEKLIQNYETILQKFGEPDEAYKYEALEAFQENWNLSSPDFYQMFTESFSKKSNLIYQNSWGFIDKISKNYPNEVKIMFENLYDEELDLSERMGNFQKESDRLLTLLKKDLNRDNLNSQQDERTLSAYLAFRYPEKYPLYKAGYYNKLCFFLNIDPQKTNSRFLHYMQILNDLKYLVEKESFREVYRQNYPPPEFDDTLMMLQNIIYVSFREDLSPLVLQQSLGNFSESEVRFFLNMIDLFLKRNGIQKNDQRLHFNYNKNELMMTIGQRDAWQLGADASNHRFGAILNDKYSQSYEEFSGQPKAVFNYFDSEAWLNRELEENALNAMSAELQRTRNSSFRKHTKPILEEFIFNQDFRNQILNETSFSENNLNYEGANDVDIFISFEDYLKKIEKHSDNTIATYVNSVKTILPEIWEDKYKSKFDSTDFSNNVLDSLVELTRDNYNGNFKGKINFQNFLKFLIKNFSILNNAMKKMQLNQILYGPPGTGKTYKTKELAVKIIDNEVPENRDELTHRYLELKSSGQIQFTTFHQSMSYEDFIEGIKPKMAGDEEGDVSYEIQDGIFKEICKNARKKVKNSNEIQSNEDPFDIAWDKLIEGIDAKLGQSETAIFKSLTDKDIKVVGITDKGNILVKPAGGSKLDYIISYNRTKKLFNAYPNLSEVKNINKEFRQVIGGSNSTAYWSILNYLHNWINDNQTLITQEDVTYSNSDKKYVLIIDEINRGNVSAIFGELITLIEEDKRAGKDEAIEVTLPYSKEKFSVPDNVYIIGTMNTADRSVEALDTALRRRFSFEEVLPKPDLLKDMEFDEIDLSELLKTINQRIELLIDKDHQIGHSYFLNVKNIEDLKNTFKDKIIPLLEEYFYGDFGKIGLVLGDKFIMPKESKNKNILAQNFKYDTDFIEDKELYEFVKPGSWDLTTFTSIYENTPTGNEQ